MSNLPKHVHALLGEGITHPKDLALFNSMEFELAVQSMKSRAALPGLAQIRLKQACDFFQFLMATSRTMKNQYLTHYLIKSHTVQFKALKDSKEVGGLTKLIELTDGLSWMDSFQKYL